MFLDASGWPLPHERWHALGMTTLRAVPADPGGEAAESLHAGDQVVFGRLALSVAEVAEALGVSRTMVSRECASGRLHSIKVGQRRLIPVSSVYDWLGTKP